MNHEEPACPAGDGDTRPHGDEQPGAGGPDRAGWRAAILCGLTLGAAAIAVLATEATATPTAATTVAGAG